jgi:hypothetical protein
MNPDQVEFCGGSIRTRTGLSLAERKAQHNHSLAAIVPPPAPRMLERGVLDIPRPDKFWMVSEGFPIWLLALDSKRASTVCILGSSSHQDFLKTSAAQGMGEALVEAAIENLGRSKVCYFSTAVLPKEAVLLVSGSLRFVKEWTHKSSTPVLVLCDTHVRS